MNSATKRKALASSLVPTWYPTLTSNAFNSSNSASVNSTKWETNEVAANEIEQS